MPVSCCWAGTQDEGSRSRKATFQPHHGQLGPEQASAQKPQKLHNVSGFGLGSIIWLPGHASVNIPLCIFQMFPDWQQLQGTYDLAEHAWMVRWTCHFCIPDFPQIFPCHFPQQLRRNIRGNIQWQVPNKDSAARDHLANERTFLAWLRTGLSLSGDHCMSHQSPGFF